MWRETGGPVVGLDGVYGSWAGRLWPDIFLAVPSPVAGEAFVVSAGPPGPRGRGAFWHRVGLADGVVLERHDLGVGNAVPVAIRADGERVVLVGSGDSRLRVRTGTGRHLWGRNGGFRHVEYLPGEDRLLAWTANGEVVELDGSTGADVARFRGFPPVAVSTTTDGRAGRFIGFRQDRDHVAVWDRVEGRVVAAWPGRPHALLPVEETGELLEHRDGEPVRCFTPGQRRPSWQAPAPVEPRWRAALDRARSRPAVLWRGAVFGYRAQEKDAVIERWPRRGHDHTVERLTVGPDGSVLATAGGWTVRLWDTRTGAELHVLPLPLGPSPRLAFSADGRLLHGTGYSERHCWSVDTGAAAPAPPEARMWSTAQTRWRAAPDGRLLWLAEDEGSRRITLKVVSLPDGEVRWRSPGFAAHAAFTADGTVVTVVGYPGPEIALVDPADGFAERRVLLPEVPSGTYEGRWALRDDGELFAVPGSRLMVYDTRTGRIRARLEVVTNIAPAFVGERWLAVLDLDHVVRVFDLDTGASTALPTDELDDRPVSLLGTSEHCYVGTLRGVAVRYSVAATENQAVRYSAATTENQAVRRNAATTEDQAVREAARAELPPGM